MAEFRIIIYGAMDLRGVVRDLTRPNSGSLGMAVQRIKLRRWRARWAACRRLIEQICDPASLDSDVDGRGLYHTGRPYLCMRTLVRLCQAGND